MFYKIKTYLKEKQNRILYFVLLILGLIILYQNLELKLFKVLVGVMILFYALYKLFEKEFD